MKGEMRKCRACLCRSCMNTCGCQECKERVATCDKYSRFEQIGLFNKIRPKPPRVLNFDDYGISKERYQELKEYARDHRNAVVVHSAAYEACPDIAEYILLSVRKNKSYESLEYDRHLGRIPCGRTDFYGYRRLFYHLLDLKLK